MIHYLISSLTILVINQQVCCQVAVGRRHRRCLFGHFFWLSALKTDIAEASAIDNFFEDDNLFFIPPVETTSTKIIKKNDRLDKKKKNSGITKALLWNTTAEPNLSGSKKPPPKNKASIQEN